MRIGKRDEAVLPLTGIVCAAVWMMTATAGMAQNADIRTGVSQPDSAPITVEDAPPAPVIPAAKPSAAIPATQSTQEVYGPYVPYTGPKKAGPADSAAASEAAFDPDAHLAGDASPRRPLGSSPSANSDDGIVTYVPSRQGEIPEGTLVKAKLREDLSTLTTRAGEKFTAEVMEPVMRDGRVIVPPGSVMEGRVTWVRGGKRIGGPAAIHLEPRTITLPDGGQYVLRARAIDTDQWDSTNVDNEGTISKTDHSKRTAAMISLSAGSGMAAGAMLGGLPGAVIGAGVGAGVSTVVWLKQDHQAQLPKDLGVIFSLTEPMSVTPISAAAAAPVKSGSTGGE
ncbi:MAG TPA: hypothetical protein VGN01_08880 [Acidobacteriaceae bacterium]